MRKNQEFVNPCVNSAKFSKSQVFENIGKYYTGNRRNHKPYSVLGDMNNSSGLVDIE